MIILVFMYLQKLHNTNDIEENFSEKLLLAIIISNNTRPYWDGNIKYSAKK